MVTFHQSNPTRWHRGTEKGGRPKDGQKKEWVEEKAMGGGARLSLPAWGLTQR